MPIRIQSLGLQPYEQTWQAMQTFTQTRTADTEDELWLVEHPAVFTQGLNGQAHYLHPSALESNLPIVQTDRGGQITYHAPGQVIIYVLVDLKRAQIGVKALVQLMEAAIIELLRAYQIEAQTRENAPGVYVNGQKIASLGLKVKKQGCYHGLALNVDMDLTPFSWITPCGLEGMQMTQMAALTNQPVDTQLVQTELANLLINPLTSMSAKAEHREF